MIDNNKLMLYVQETTMYIYKQEAYINSIYIEKQWIILIKIVHRSILIPIHLNSRQWTDNAQCLKHSVYMLRINKHLNVTNVYIIYMQSI